MTVEVVRVLVVVEFCWYNMVVKVTGNGVIGNSNDCSRPERDANWGRQPVMVSSWR